jgi:hypothetical protein
MTPFQYPKTKHFRILAPRKYKRYPTYKRWLQKEFSRSCVYCRQPDSSAPNIIFGVDHYRPKGILRFANLVTTYANLYYCCGSCNSRKNNYWPIDEKKDPWVVAPCEHVMVDHLRFNSTTGEIETRTTNGRFTEELLQLNDVALVKYRLSTLKIISICSREIKLHESQATEAKRMLVSGSISQAEFDIESADIKQEIDQMLLIMQSHSGELPTRALPKQRFGVSLVAS